MAGSKQQVFYIHGGEAFSSYENFLENLRTKTVRGLPGEEQLKKWSGNLAEDLGDEYAVFRPQMPNKQNAKYEEWKIWFERHFEHLRDDVILLGWSQGGYFLLKYLCENTFPFKIKGLFLVAAPCEPEAFGLEDGGDFNFDIEQLPNVTKKVKNIFIFHSKDDPVVPFSHGEKLAQALPEAEFITFTDKNHFLIEEFPELISKIKALR